MYKFGVICPSEIAARRFLPALTKIDNASYIGVGVHSNRVKAVEMSQKYGGIVFDSYEDIIKTDLIDCLYVPLPPALHYEWAQRALLSGKNVLLEKPATLSVKEAEMLIDIAEKNNLTIHENYMFAFHKQLDEIRQLLDSNTIGKVRLINLFFGFPKRKADDFRYNLRLGGGALYDAGGYVIKLASILLGEKSKVVHASMNYEDDIGVDLYGAGTMTNEKGMVVQFSFGMDNDYRCSLDAWGSEGSLRTNRIFTAPDGFTPTYEIIRNGERENFELSSDDSFKKSIEYFLKSISDQSERKRSNQSIIRQATLVEEFIGMAEKRRL